jgi:NAD(P)-dependent dehydrogenase (short-subunit alcohol dehydrogenase family)
MDTGLAGKTAIVTGATANIGRAIALALAIEGMRVAVIGRDHVKGHEIATEARERGAADAIFITTDLTDRAAVEAMTAEVLRRWDTVDVLVNNVGGNTHPFTLFAESDPATWQSDIDLNLRTTLLCSRSLLPHMIARKSGRIINIGSTAGEVGDYGLALYSAAKGAVHAFTRVLAREVGEHNITVNCVAPYGTMPEDPVRDTSSGSRFHPTRGLLTRQMALRAPSFSGKLGRKGVLPRNLVKPTEVAAAVVYLASNCADFVTGQIHFIEGGTLL